MAEAADTKQERKSRRISGKSLKRSLKIFRYVLPYRATFGIGMVFLVLSTVTSLAFPYIISELVGIAGGSPSIMASSINMATFILLVAIIGQAIFSFFRVLFFARVTEYAVAHIRTDLYNRIIRLPISFFEEQRVGELMSRITSDVEQIRDTLSITLAEFFRQIMTLLIGTGMILIYSPTLTLLMISTFPLIVILVMTFGRFIRRLARKTQDALAKTNVIVEETFQSINIVKAFTNEQFESGRYRNSMNKVVSIAMREAIYRGGFISFIIAGLFGGITLVMWYGAGMVQNGEIGIEELLGFVFYTIFIGGAVGGMGDVYAKIQKTIGASERVLGILDEEPEVKQHLPVAKDQRLSGNIQFNEVAFAYPTRPEVEVLKKISFTIHPGEKVALVGPSGAGKTTITQLIMGFYHIGEGELLIDDKPIATYNLQELRNNLGVVPQVVILFGGTIRENIAYGNPEATEAEIIEASKQANAWNFIQDFPEGLETIVGERGVKLSGGQKQRVAIARAILKDPAILILDEATSSLDAESEVLVQEALEQLMEHRTSIVIAHRLSTIRKVDKILVISDGQIQESGKHEDLAANPGGLYANLLKLQFQSA